MGAITDITNNTNQEYFNSKKSACNNSNNYCNNTYDNSNKESNNDNNNNSNNSNNSNIYNNNDNNNTKNNSNNKNNNNSYNNNNNTNTNINYSTYTNTNNKINSTESAVIPNKPTTESKLTLSPSYILSLSKHILSNKTSLLPKGTLDHIFKMAEPSLRLLLSQEKDDEKQTSRTKSCDVFKVKNKERGGGLEIWARKDFSKEIEQAENYMRKMKEKMGDGESSGLVMDVKMILNTLTVDNYNLVLQNLTEKLSEDKAKSGNLFNQTIELLINKSLHEKCYINLYVKLIKDLRGRGGQRRNMFELITENICKIMGEIDANLTKECLNDLSLTKKPLFGLVDLICELVNNEIFDFDNCLVYFQKITNKITRENNKIDDLYLEALINFFSQLGKILYNKKDTFNLKIIENIIETDLSSFKNNGKIPSNLRYKIINLEEKQKNNWEESLFEKSLVAKGRGNYNLTSQILTYNDSEDSEEEEKPLRDNGGTKFDGGIKVKESEKGINDIENNIKNNIKNNENDSKNYTEINDKAIIKSKSSVSLSLNSSLRNQSSTKDSLFIQLKDDLDKYIKFLHSKNIKLKQLISSDLCLDFDWERIESLLKKYNFSAVLISYLKILGDFLRKNNKSKDFLIVKKYMEIIVDYYSPGFSFKQRNLFRAKIGEILPAANEIVKENKSKVSGEVVGDLMINLLDNDMILIEDFKYYSALSVDDSNEGKEAQNEKEGNLSINLKPLINCIVSSERTKDKKYLQKFSDLDLI